MQKRRIWNKVDLLSFLFIQVNGVSELGGMDWDRGLCLKSLRWTPVHLAEVLGPTAGVLQQNSFPLQQSEGFLLSVCVMP